MWIFAIIAVFVTVVVIMLVSLLLGPIIAPIYDVASTNGAVQQVGFDTGVETIMLIGGTYVLPLSMLAIFIWFLVLRLKSDEFQGARRR